jgi:multidrug efflux pump subunit AcrA (membrane-fusion protein)
VTIGAKPWCSWAILVIAAGLAMTACGYDAATPEKTAPAVLDTVPGSDISRITLTERAAARLDIQTGTVATAGRGAALHVPFAAVVYHADGSTWVYTNPEGLIFVRAPIEIVRIEGDTALLTDGPEPGTRVVTNGASELLGFESGIGK